MSNEERKLSRELGWIIGLGLLGVVAAYLIDPGPCDEPPMSAASQDPLDLWQVTTGSAPEKPTNPDRPR